LTRSTDRDESGVAEQPVNVSSVPADRDEDSTAKKSRGDTDVTIALL